MLNRMSREACPRVEDTAFAASPLLASAVRENVRIVGGRLLIPLLPRWPVLIRGLRTFGPVISFCGNPWALLGTAGRYPEVWSTPCGRKARGGDLEFFFPPWSRAFATIEKESGSWIYAAEFVDSLRNVLHKIHLTAESDWEAFRWWVEINRAPSPVAETSPYVRVRSGVGVGLASCEDEILPVSETVFRAMLRQIVQEEFSVQVCLSNEGLAQRAEVSAKFLREKRDSLLLAAVNCGLQTRPGDLGEICFQRSRTSPGWALKAYEPGGRLVFSVMAPADCCVQRAEEMLAALLRKVREG